MIPFLPAGRARSRPALLARLRLAAAAAVVALVAAPAASAAPAKIRLTKVSPVAGSVGVRGTVGLPAGIARARARVVVQLSGDGAGTKRTVRVSSKRTFRVVLRTSLSGEATVRARVRIGGRSSGKLVRRAITIPGGGDAAGSGSGGDEIGDGALVGTFRVTEGKRTSAGLSGSYFRMKTPTGDYLGNYSSRSSDTSVTPFRPGTDGGLRTGVFQSAPSPAFDGDGNALANRIVQPETFFGVRFGVSTNAIDPQTGTRVGPPQITNSGGELSGQITAWAAQWNTQSFNQGSPKPDGSSPGFTRPLTGTIDPKTGKFVLEWASLIVGGPFDTFAGEWHLEGTFVPGS